MKTTNTTIIHKHNQIVLLLRDKNRKRRKSRLLKEKGALEKKEKTATTRNKDWGA